MDKHGQINNEILPAIVGFTKKYGFIKAKWDKFTEHIRESCKNLNLMFQERRVKAEIEIEKFNDKSDFEFAFNYFTVSFLIRLSLIEQVICGKISFGDIKYDDNGEKRFNELETIFINEHGHILEDKNHPKNILGFASEFEDVQYIFLSWIKNYFSKDDQKQ